ncbi:MAG TPA: DNA glycosylase [Chthoniobacterales bacterium]|jgi:N-glycosylase/DNA lyase|nr:DNA glycosylase [Chthoniobacterales bacterium]
MNLQSVRAPVFNLEKTLNCGQVFHWENSGAGFIGAIDTKAAYLEQRGNCILFQGVTHQQVASYLALDHPLREICSSFPADPAMSAARKFCQGLRIIRQPEWECLATFICSSMKQVAHIRQISLALRRSFGVRKTINGTHVYAFPSPMRLGMATEGELRGCALGYRAKNLLATAQLVASGEAPLKKWRQLKDEELRENLCGLPGVGAKVANCVMLFAYERLRAFPIDVWIERVLRQQYFPGTRKLSARELREFCDQYFGEHGGYAQQYLFHHARTGRRVDRERGRQAKVTQVVRPADLRYDLPVKRRPVAAPRR